MFAYDKTFDPEVVVGHYDLISQFSDFAIYLGTQLVHEHTVFRICSRMTRSFDPEVVLGHCDLISWFSDFALYLDTQLVFFMPPTLKKLEGHIAFGLSVCVSVCLCVC